MFYLSFPLYLVVCMSTATNAYINPCLSAKAVCDAGFVQEGFTLTGNNLLPNAASAVKFCE